MATKAEEALVDALIEETREQREIIRQLIRESIDAENYWKEFALKLAQKVSAS